MALAGRAIAFDGQHTKWDDLENERLDKSLGQKNQDYVTRTRAHNSDVSTDQVKASIVYSGGAYITQPSALLHSRCGISRSISSKRQDDPGGHQTSTCPNCRLHVARGVTRSAEQHRRPSISPLASTRTYLIVTGDCYGMDLVAPISGSILSQGLRIAPPEAPANGVGSRGLSTPQLLSSFFVKNLLRPRSFLFLY